MVSMNRVVGGAARKPPPPSVRKRLSRWIRLTIRRAGFRLRELVHPYERKDGVLFIGYTNVVFGLGADFRGLITALCDA